MGLCRVNVSFWVPCARLSRLMNKYIVKQGGLGVDLVPETEPGAAEKTREPPPPILNFPSATTAVASGYWSKWTYERSLLAPLQGAPRMQEHSSAPEGG
jgi:hypothetical protein